jgi:cbb3-type cytochrome oxidase subunit 3
VFFLGMLVWIYSLDKKYIDKMKGLPLEDADEQDSIDKN